MAGYLDRLELENFKSYKGHQIIGPFRKFTAIIGPNGAGGQLIANVITSLIGKSNLMDAISFVLGEQTRNLRVKSLKELIHGAPIGKPVASTASVVAYYKDSNGTETSYSRTIVEHRTEHKSDWKSVYKINDKVKSAAEYNSALHKFGINIKAKNFLVFQGAVESIAMKTPKERTQLFEEISGSKEYITEYEEKKQAMSKAQEETAYSFQKKKGISLEKKEAKAEKEEAEKYKKVAEELAEIQVKEQLFKLYHNERNIDSLTKDIKRLQKLVDKETRRRNKLEDEVKAKRQESARKTRELNIKEKEIREKEMELNVKKPRYIKAKEETSHVIKRLQAQKKTLEKAKEKDEEQSQRVESLERELGSVQEAAEAFEQEMREESQEDLQLQDTQVAEYHRLKEAAGKRSASLAQQLERTKHEQSVDEEELEQSKMKKKELETRMEQLTGQLSQYNQKLERLDQYIKTSTEQLSKYREDHDKLSSEMKRAELRYAEVNEALEEIHHKIRDARVDSHENSRAQRKLELLDNLKRLYPGVHGRLFDLCEPVHRRYTIAVTKIMGRHMDSIVVDNAKTGRDCIQHIKEMRGDPCTFLPLDSIEYSPINESLRSLGGSAKLVIDVIKCDSPTIKPALLFACGNSLVCDNMEEARRIAFGSYERRKTVSLDGTLFQKSGIISGGASNIKAKARRWDEKQVENLRRQKTKHIEEIQGLVAVRRKMSELQTLKSEVNGLESRLNYSKKDRENTANYLISKIEKEIDQINQEIQSLEPKMTRIQSSIDKRNRDLHKLESKINKVEDEIFKDFCNMIGVSNIRQYEEKQLHNQQMRSKKKLEFANQISRLENQLEYERRRDTKSIIRKLMGSIADDEKSIDALEAQEEDLLKVIESIEEVIEEKKSEKRNIQKVYEEQDIEAKELKKMLGNSIKELTSLQKQLNSIETELDQNKFDRHSLLKTCKLNDIQIPMSDGSMDDIGGGNETESNSQSTDTLDTGMEIDSTSTQGAKLLYERESKIVVDYSDLDKKYTDVNDDGELKTLAQELNLQRSRLQNMMQRMTMPNLRALDKLGDVESRLLETAAEFEQTRAMARKSKTDFARIKKKRFDDFSRAFDHVSTIIDEIYKKLCNNSSAQAFLAVENSEEPYLDGVTYNCIAPSKRYRPMDNLSGGEKTVAALALLFAIHSYQPSPFFVLDEIDAALDNTNINRVAQYITEQASEGKFQCIVISLKEEFYSHADALIGIYCEPGGECTISQMLTYDLSLHFSDLTSPTKRLKSS